GYGQLIYEKAMCVELAYQKIPFKRQCRFGLRYRDVLVGQGQIDLLIDGELVVEVKAVDVLAPVHTAQVLAYLSTADLHRGLLLNSKVRLMKRRMRRVIWSRPRSPRAAARKSLAALRRGDRIQNQRVAPGVAHRALIAREKLALTMRGGARP